MGAPAEKYASIDLCAEPPLVSRLGVQGLGFELWGLGFGVWGLRCEVWGLGFEVSGVGCRVSGAELRGGGLGCGVDSPPPYDGSQGATRLRHIRSTAGSGAYGLYTVYRQVFEVP